MQSPSAAMRSAFFAAFICPFLRRKSIASSIFPSVAVRAFLQSIMPAPLASLNSLTIDAVMFAILETSVIFKAASLNAGGPVFILCCLIMLLPELLLLQQEHLPMLFRMLHPDKPYSLLPGFRKHRLPSFPDLPR